MFTDKDFSDRVRATGFLPESGSEHNSHDKEAGISARAREDDNLPGLVIRPWEAGIEAKLTKNEKEVIHRFLRRIAKEFGRGKLPPMGGISEEGEENSLKSTYSYKKLQNILADIASSETGLEAIDGYAADKKPDPWQEVWRGDVWAKKQKCTLVLVYRLVHYDSGLRNCEFKAELFNRIDS